MSPAFIQVWAILQFKPVQPEVPEFMLEKLKKAMPFVYSFVSEEVINH